MTKRPPPSPLGDFELLVLLAVMRAGDAAYGSTILSELQEGSGRIISRGALYITLDRLEAKGCLGSRVETGPSSRGGRPRRYYTVKTAGLALIRHSLDALARMRERLALGLKHS
jgi:DNA-binding PadR family transcriptional regulator